MRIRRACLCLAVVLLAACAPGPASREQESKSEDWWPGPATLNEPVQLLEIPSLSDEAFLARARRGAEAARKTPTNRKNWKERIDLARQIYNALEAGGILMPRLVLLGTNLVEARTSDPDELFLIYAGAVDALLGNLEAFLSSRDAFGSIETSPSAGHSFRAREYTTLEAVYRVGSTPIGKGAKLRFSADWYNDMGPIQFSRPLLPGYTTVRCSNPAVRLATGMEFWNAVWGSLYPPGLTRPQVTVLQGTLFPGDTLTITLGDRSGGGPGLLIQSTEIDVFPLRFELSPRGEPLGFFPIGEPHFRVHGANPHHIRVVAPTTVRPGESFTVKGCVEDLYLNRASDPSSSLSLWQSELKIGEEGPIPGNPAIFHFKGITLPENAAEPVVFTVKDSSGVLWGQSNPVIVIAPDAPRIYWGEIHGHEAYTDGSGTAEWYTRYARDIGFLDFASLSCHDIMISELHLRDAQRATSKYNQPGTFVTLKGYEWTQDTRFGGHHNVYYRGGDQRILPSYEAPTIADLYRRQREVNGAGNVLIIPHAHQPGDWNFNDAVMERLVEIYSSHGSFEWFGRRYLERGYQVGLITAGDDHTGHPGNTPAFTTNRAGNAAVFSAELTRDALFDALVARRVYGTTLARIYVDTRVEGIPMGGEITVDPPVTPSIHITGRVAGTASIARLVAVCNGKDSRVADYLKPRSAPGPGAKPVVRVLVASTSEPADPGKVAPPRGSTTWQGRILLGKGYLAGVTPIGLEGLADNFVQTSERRVDFFSVTRGDEDGALLSLGSWDGRDVLTLEVYKTNNVDSSARGLVRSERARWGEDRLRPDRDLATRVTIPLEDLLAGPQRRDLDESSWVTVELVAADLPSYREFAFDVTQNVRLDGENYVYLRVEQIDDHRAWSSPVWVSFRR